jgi:hypothetical protein
VDGSYSNKSLKYAVKVKTFKNQQNPLLYEEYAKKIIISRLYEALRAYIGKIFNHTLSKIVINSYFLELYINKNF